MASCRRASAAVLCCAFFLVAPGRPVKERRSMVTSGMGMGGKKHYIIFVLYYIYHICIHIYTYGNFVWDNGESIGNYVGNDSADDAGDGMG